MSKGLVRRCNIWDCQSGNDKHRHYQLVLVKAERFIELSHDNIAREDKEINKGLLQGILPPKIIHDSYKYAKESIYEAVDDVKSAANNSSSLETRKLENVTKLISLWRSTSSKHWLRPRQEKTDENAADKLKRRRQHDVKGQFCN